MLFEDFPRKEVFKSSRLRVEAIPYQLNFKYPFRLSIGTRNHTQIVVLRIQSEGIAAYGEAALPPYLGESVESVLAFYAGLDWHGLLDFDVVQERLWQVGTGNNAAKASVEIALHDLAGKKSGKSVAELYGIVNESGISTTFTLGISNKVELSKKLIDAKDYGLIKLKLGTEDDRALVKAFTSKSNKSFCVDINQGWRNKNEAAKLIEFIVDQGALFIEQPMPFEWLDEMAWLCERVDVPIIADESVRRFEDLEVAAEVFDGINIKLMKSTGLFEAKMMLEGAKDLGLKTVFGAMAESSLGVGAASHLAAAADWVDLDGPLLINNDPFKGPTYRHGKVHCPSGAGIGSLPIIDWDI